MSHCAVKEVGERLLYLRLRGELGADGGPIVESVEVRLRVYNIQAENY